jgi:ankyrin repeat protein
VTGYDPDNPQSWPAVGLFRDWAGLQFLLAIGEQKNIGCPQFYDGDRGAGFFVMEDLGAAEDLDHVLTCGSKGRAERTLVKLAETLGRMHATSAGKEAAFLRIRSALGPGDAGRREGLAGHVLAAAPKLAQQCQKLGVLVSPQFSQDIQTVATAMAEPGPLLAYTHADPCPDNCLVVEDRICLIDFEFGGFRHALLDGVYGRLRFPTCKCVRDIPASVVEIMEAAYREELAQGIAAVNDDALFFRAVTDACAYWMLENLSHLLAEALEYEQPLGLATNRQRLVSRLAAFLEVSDRSGHLRGLQQTLARLYDVLAAAWRSELPLFDAFDQSAEIGGEEFRAFVAAFKAGRVERVRELLQKERGLAKAKAEDSDQTPALYLAAETKNGELVRLLLEHGADWRTTTRSGWTILAKACAEGTPETVDLLLKHGADVNRRDMWGSLPIYGANAAMREYLLARGAQIDLKTAFDLGRLDLARQMLQEDAGRARFRFGTGMSLLHDLAQAQQENVAAIELLLTAGADIDAQTNWGATPLHLAAFNGRARTVDFLLRRGAQPQLPDKRGQTALAVAQARGHRACAELLVAAMSR